MRPGLRGVPLHQGIALHMSRNALRELQSALWLARQSDVTDEQLALYLELPTTTLDTLRDEDDER